VFQANIDDDVKVLVIRGEGDHLGSGGDLNEHGDLYLNPGPDDNFLDDLEIEDPVVKYPPAGSFRYLHGLTDYYAKARSGNRPLQEFKKISIIEAKGYCYGWHFYQCADADIIVLGRRAVRPSVVPLRRLGPAHVAVAGDGGPAPLLGDAVHRPAVHRR
jgi:enoyl-CoA hydratase/carnithine racemase